MKYISVTVDVKQGLPNYSSRGASVTVVADDGESLDVVTAVQHVKSQIELGLSGQTAAKPAAITPKEPTAVRRGTPKGFRLDIDE